MKANLYKLKYSLYYDEDGDVALPYRYDNTYKLLAKKGQLAERFELTDELREEHSIYYPMWKYIWIFRKGCNYLLTQTENCDDFEKRSKL